MDSINFLPMALAKLPLASGQKELHKGFFPHLWNTKPNKDYAGPYPDAKYYDPEGMSSDKRQEFYNWYEKQKGKQFVLRDELLKNRLDDLMQECGKDPQITKLFTQGSHHRNLSVIYIVQNLFHQSKESRTISLNCHYIVLFKNPRDRSQIVHLAKQMYPGQTKFMVEAYADATSLPHSYLFIDLKPHCPEEHRLRSCIFPGETSYAYVPK